jgi:EpsI family protein
MASVMVGTLFAYLNYRSYKKRWAFLGVAVVTPLVANWLRAYMIVMLGHLSGNRLAVGVDHIIYGWVFFGIIMLAMFMIGARWSEPDPEHEPAPAGASTPAASPARWSSAVLIALAMVALPPLLRSQAHHAGAHGEPVLAAPALPRWTWQAEPLVSWQPHFSGAAAAVHGRYAPESGGPAVGLYVGYYRDQRYGRQLVTSVNQLSDDEADRGWSQTARGQAQLDTPSGPLPWRTAELRGQALGEVSGGGGQAPRLRVWQVYWINGRPFTSDWQAKLYGAWQRLLGQGDDAAVVLVYMDKAAAGAEDAVLRDFVRAHWAELDTALRGVRDRDAARKQ